MQIHIWQELVQDLCEKFVQSTSLGDRLESSLLELYPINVRAGTSGGIGLNNNFFC